jgi:hypothetical protein
MTDLHSQLVCDAITIIGKLQDWFDENSGAADITPSMTLTPTSVEVLAGPMTLWSSSLDASKELTFEYCRTAFLGTVSEFHAFIDEARDRFGTD